MSAEQLLITMLEKVNYQDEIGFKELSWSKKELDEFVKKCRTTQGLLNSFDRIY